MLTPGLADLFEPLVVSGAAAHSVEILRNKRMVIAWQCNPSHVNRPFVTRIGSQSEADAASDRTIIRLLEANQITDDDVGAGNGPNARFIAGSAADFTSPLASSWSISIGCIAAPTEIFPTIEPASDGRPSALANSFDIRSRPSVMLNDCAFAS